MEPKEFDIEFPRGDTVPINFDLRDKNGASLNDLDEIYFTVKQSYAKQDYILQKRLTRGEITHNDGVFALVLTHKDTASLKYGKYVYDIQIKSGDYYKTVCIGQITLSNESTWINNE